MRVAIVVLLLAGIARADWSEDLDRLLAAPAGEARDTLLESVARSAPGCGGVADHLRGVGFSATTKGEALLRETTCTDGVKRPWVLVVPDAYDPARPTPLMVVLHGGVSQAEVEPDPLAHAGRNHLAALARSRGWLALLPYGQKGATWWDEVGMANIRHLVRTVKRERNVDDDRVFMAGVSDGASAGFLHAMIDSDDYGAVAALLGHMGVGSLDGELDTYAPNFFNTPIYAITNDRDALYPSARMRATIDMANRAGGRIFYRERFGEHRTEDILDELPAVGDWLARHARDPFPMRVVWETSSARFGRCRWLAIDRITTDDPAPWHRDHNVSLTEDRVSIGFWPGEHDGTGVKVGTVVEKTFAEKIGLVPGDVIVTMNDLPVADLAGLSEAKTTVKRGDRVVLVVMRDGKKVTLADDLPPPSHYFLFKRSRPSGMARARFAANRFDLETSRVGALRLLIHSEMVRFDMPVLVRVNGKVVHDAPVTPDVRVLLGHFLENRDRKRLVLAEIPIEP